MRSRRSGCLWPKRLWGRSSTSDPSSNATIQALGRPAGPDWMEGRGTGPVLLGQKVECRSVLGVWHMGSRCARTSFMPAGELPTSLLVRIETFVTRGDRVLLVARTAAPLTGDVLPTGLEPACLVVLEERIRPMPATTIDYLKSQGIEIKVLSGDDPRTVGSIAARVGIPGSATPVDARDLPDDPTALADGRRSDVDLRPSAARSEAGDRLGAPGQRPRRRHDR